MARLPIPEEFGEPAVKVAGFQLWIHGWGLTDATDYDDANWLRVTAHCGAGGASVWTSGAILQAPDLLRWGEDCEALASGRAVSAALVSVEPELTIDIRPIDALGHYAMRVTITPDHLTQKHSFEFEIDQTYLPEIVRQCRLIAKNYPARGLQSERRI